MATSKLSFDEGTDVNVATNTVSEDAVTKHINRTVLNTSAGAEVAPLTDTQLRATALPVSGTVTANVGTVGTLATASKQDTGNTSLGSIDTKLPAQGQALAAASVPVILPSATITTLTPPAAISGFATAAKQDTIIGHVDGIETALAGILDVDTGLTTQTDALTDTQLRATAVPVSGTVAVTGVATSAKQPALGTAGTASADVITVQGRAAMTPVLTDGSATTQPVSGTVTANIGTVSTLATAAKQDTGNTSLSSIDGKITAVNTGAVVLAAGSAAVGKLAANSGVDIGDVDVTSISAGTNNIGQVNVAPQTANGLSVFAATSSDGSTALTSTAQVIKATAGQLYGWYIYNPNTTAQFVQLYNVAQASVTVGTTNPLFMLTIPPTSAANVEYTNGITFSNTGWSTAATATAGGNGAPTIALDCVLFYK